MSENHEHVLIIKGSYLSEGEKHKKKGRRAEIALKPW